jgi:hypothetical protein
LREDQIDQAERREVLENDRRVREQQQAQGSTFHAHAQAQAGELSGGRFASLGASTVTGATPIPKYPAAGAHQSDPVGIEPPLGIDINAMPGLENPADVSVSPSAEPGGAAAPSVPPDVEPAPPSFSNKWSE